MILTEKHLEVVAITLCVLGLLILYFTLTFTPEQGFGKIDENNVYITGMLTEKIPVEDGWIYPVEACESVTVWSEEKTHHTGLVNITGSKRGDFFIADTIKKR